MEVEVEVEVGRGGGGEGGEEEEEGRGEEGCVCGRETVRKWKTGHHFRGFPTIQQVMIDET